MKKLFTLLTLLLCAVTGAVAQDTTLFLWQSDGSTTAKGTTLSATGGTAVFEGSANPSAESASYNAEVTDSDLKPAKKGMKLGTNTLYLKITLTGGNELQEGDIIYICGYNSLRVGTGQTTNRANTDLASSLTTGTKKEDYNVGKVTVPSDIVGGIATIYISRAEGSGTGLAAVKIVRPAPTTDPYISAGDDTSVTATESDVEVTTDIAVTGKNLTGSTLTATLSPAVAGLSVTLASNTITDGAISTTATLHYKATENASGSTTLTLSDGTTSKEVTVNYKSKVVASVLQTISEATAWDFSKDVTGSKRFTTDSEKNTEYVYVDIDDLTFASTFKAEALAFKGEYPFRGPSNKYAQNGVLHFKTSVPGSIIVKFSDTGTSASKDAVKRYLVVNDEKTEYWTSRENNGSDNPYSAKLNVTTGEIPVDAGDVYIKGTSALTYSTVTFTPSAINVTVPASGVATLASAKALDFSDADVEAYVVSSLSSTSATLESVTEVPANTGVILKGTTGTHKIKIHSGTPANPANLLQAAVTETPVDANKVYVLKEGEFHKVTAASTVPAGKAYLLASDVPASAASLALDFDGTDEHTTGIENVEAQKSFLDGEFYNLAGQRVAQPAKGLYIVNGKKVVIK